MEAEDTAEPIEVDPEEAEEEEVLPPVSLEIFDDVKSSHAQHGLRHGDYVRYRQYCTRRLHRLRKTVGQLHGKGRFARRTLEPRMVRDSKHLMLPLYMAERAWAYAMALKRDNTAQESRPRHHLVARLNKAAKWSATLSALCAKRGDERTALESEAYSGFMHGNMHLEREQWASALTHLKKTRTICTELCRVSMSDQVKQYKAIVEEVDPSIRFCSYNLRRLGEGGDDDGADETDGMMGLLDGEGGSDILRSKLEAVLQESRARQARAAPPPARTAAALGPLAARERSPCLASRVVRLAHRMAALAMLAGIARWHAADAGTTAAAEGTSADTRLFACVRVHFRRSAFRSSRCWASSCRSNRTRCALPSSRCSKRCRTSPWRRRARRG
jgi:signal recognition particle subunit SRP68